MGREENEVSDAVRKFLEDHGYMVFRMQSGVLRGAGGYITLNKKGTPDLLAICKATQRAVFIETKTKEGKASKEQLEFQESYNALGGQSLIVHSLGELIQKLTLEV